MTPHLPARTVASGMVALLTAGALLLGATPALAATPDPGPLSYSHEAPPAAATTDSAAVADATVARAADTYYNALVGGEELARGESIVSTNGSSTFVFQQDGNAVTYDANGRATWSTGTQNRGDRLVMQNDGNVVIYAADGRPVWFTGTTDEPGAALTIQDDGNLVVYRANGTPAWASSVGGVIAPPATDTLGTGESLRSGRQLTSGDGRFKAVMQSDGNLVGYGPQGVTWNTGTSGAGNRLVMQEDGNAVIYGADGSVKWFTSSSGAGARMNLDNAGRLVVYSQDDVMLWSSRNAFPSSTLFAPAGLEPGENLVSANRVYTAVMQRDGNFVVYGQAGPIWSTGSSTAGSSFSIDEDGYMAVANFGGVGWSALPRYFVNVGPAVPPFRVVMQDDGNLVQYDGRGRAVWASRGV